MRHMRRRRSDRTDTEIRAWPTILQTAVKYSPTQRGVSGKDSAEAPGKPADRYEPLRLFNLQHSQVHIIVDAYFFQESRLAYPVGSKVELLCMDRICANDLKRLKI